MDEFGGKEAGKNEKPNSGREVIAPSGKFERREVEGDKEEVEFKGVTCRRAIQSSSVGKRGRIEDAILPLSGLVYYEKRYRRWGGEIVAGVRGGEDGRGIDL